MPCPAESGSRRLLGQKELQGAPNSQASFKVQPASLQKALADPGTVTQLPRANPFTAHKMYRYIQDVPIPAELAYGCSDLELEIERCGDEPRIRPAGRPITGALESLAAFSSSFLPEGREQGEQQARILTQEYN